MKTMSGWMLAILLLGGCAKKPEVKAESPPTTSPKSQEAASVVPKTETASSSACVTDTDCPEGELCSQRVCTPINASISARCLRQPVEEHQLPEGEPALHGA
jgi:hypothetical protein